MCLAAIREVGLCLLALALWRLPYPQHCFRLGAKSDNQPDRGAPVK